MKEMNEKLPYEKAQMQVIEIQSEAMITASCLSDCNPETE